MTTFVIRRRPIKKRVRKISVELIIQRLEQLPEKIGIDLDEWVAIYEILLPEYYLKPNDKKPADIKPYIT